MPENEMKYFIEHQKELVEKYYNKFIILKGNNVVGVYDSISDAYNEASKKYELGTFSIQQCIPGEEAYTQTFNSRVIFA